jgi:predicted ATP-grasp superfamily ATP-dependent carboligase
MANIGGGKTVDFYYIIVDTTHPSWSEIVDECRTRHRVSHPDNDLSVILNNAESEALIKVTDADESWRSGRTWRAAISQTYTEADRQELHDLMDTPEWKRQV